MSGNKRKRIYDITGGRCFYCGCRLEFNEFHVDHFTAKSKGGKGSNNLVPSCIDCNLSKGNMSVEEFRDKLSNLLIRNIDGRLISKYYEITLLPIKFYFEEVLNGVIQNGQIRFLGRRKSN